MESTETISKQLDETASVIQEHVESRSTSVLTSINHWISVLDDKKELKGITKGLESLKKALTDKDGKKIVELMTSLGNDTVECAEAAKGAEATKIKAIGKALLAGAKTISAFSK